jgi:TRAP-type C4-dicarboxylate transport system permease small subunit
VTGGGADHRFARALDALYLACIWGAGIAIALMSVIIPVGVVMRYVFGFGAQWPEPIAILLMMVFTFIGAAAAYRAGGHIAVAMFTDALPAPLRSAAARLADAGMAVLSAFVLWYGGRLCQATMGQTISELPLLPVGVTYLPIPLGAAATLVFVLERIAYGAQTARAVVRVGEIE